MTGRLFSALIIVAIVVVGALVGSATHLRAQGLPLTPAAVSDAPRLVADESGMVALQRHAQVNMILYRSERSRADYASVRSTLDAVALTLPESAR